MTQYERVVTRLAKLMVDDQVSEARANNLNPYDDVYASTIMAMVKDTAEEVLIEDLMDAVAKIMQERMIGSTQ